MKTNINLFTILFKVSLIALIILFLSSCKVIQIGEVTIISTRNYEKTQNYTLLKSYTLGTKKEKLSSKEKTIKDAINKTVRVVAGGEYLANAKLYLIIKGNNKYYAVEGDVWGIEGVEQSYRGFQIGDMVQYKILGHWCKGTITGWIDDEKCLIIQDGKLIGKPINFVKNEIIKIQK